MRSVLITGASKGIGSAAALALAKTGKYNKIVLNSFSDISGLEDTASKIKASGVDNTLVSLGDVGNISYTEKLLSEAGGVDVIINNAGISHVGLLIDTQPEDWERVMKTNITSIYNVCHTFLPYMVKQKQGYILNISSVWGEVGASCEVAYSASKGAVNAFTRALAKEMAPSNIQVNAIEFGIIDTQMNDNLSYEEKSELIDTVPSGYIASTEEAAEAIVRMLDMPPYFTGDIVRVDGGWI